MASSRAASSRCSLLYAVDLRNKHSTVYVSYDDIIFRSMCDLNWILSADRRTDTAYLLLSSVATCLSLPGTDCAHSSALLYRCTADVALFLRISSFPSSFSCSAIWYQVLNAEIMCKMSNVLKIMPYMIFCANFKTLMGLRNERKTMKKGYYSVVEPCPASSSDVRGPETLQSFLVLQNHHTPCLNYPRICCSQTMSHPKPTLLHFYTGNCVQKTH